MLKDLLIKYLASGLIYRAYSLRPESATKSIVQETNQIKYQHGMIVYRAKVSASACHSSSLCQLVRAIRLHILLHSRVLALHTRLNERRVSKDEERRGADEPEQSREGGRPPEEGNANDKKAGVERLLGHDVVADLHWLRSPFVYCDETTNQESESDQQERVGNQGVHRQNRHYDAIVARKVSCIVRNASSSLVKVCRPREPLVIKKLGNRSQSAQPRFSELLDGFLGTKDNVHGVDTGG